MSFIKRILLVAVASVLIAQPASALDVKLEVVADGLQSPIDLKEAPDGSGRLYVLTLKHGEFFCRSPP